MSITIEDLKEGKYIQDYNGDVYRIDFICNCSQCRERGFSEPRLSNGEYITQYSYKTGFIGYEATSDNILDLLETKLSKTRVNEKLDDLFKEVCCNNPKAKEWFNSRLQEYISR
jgi:hypothetical protein